MSTENNNKRKAGLSPQDEKVKLSKKKNKLTSDELSEEYDSKSRGRKSRTPSGMDLQNIVSENRNIFSPCKVIKKSVIPKRTTQTKINQAFSVASINKRIVNRAAKSSRPMLTRRQASLNSNKNKQAANHDQSDSSGWEDNNTSMSDDCDETVNGPSPISENLQSQRSFDRMSELVSGLAGMLPRNAKQTRQQNKTATGGMEAASSNEKTCEMEGNDADNPETMAITSVISMFNQLRMEVAEAITKTATDVKKDLSSFKKKCVNDAAVEIAQVVEK